MKLGSPAWLCYEHRSGICMSAGDQDRDSSEDTADALGVGSLVADVEITAELGHGGGVQIWAAARQDGAGTVVFGLDDALGTSARDQVLAAAAECAGMGEAPRGRTGHRGCRRPPGWRLCGGIGGTRNPRGSPGLELGTQATGRPVSATLPDRWRTARSGNGAWVAATTQHLAQHRI